MTPETAPTHLKVPSALWDEVVGVLLRQPAGDVFGILQAIQHEVEPLHGAPELAAVEEG